jgi:hypothetical protein
VAVVVVQFSAHQAQAVELEEVVEAQVTQTELLELPTQEAEAVEQTL